MIIIFNQEMQMIMEKLQLRVYVYALTILSWISHYYLHLFI